MGKGNKQVASSYRPISLTIVGGKILERIIARNLIDYIGVNNILKKLSTWRTTREVNGNKSTCMRISYCRLHE